MDEARAVAILDYNERKLSADLESIFENISDDEADAREENRAWLEEWNAHLVYHHKRGWLQVRP